jgi:hypothetical protein
MNNFPSWIPNLRSWLNAIALIVLVMGLQRIIFYLWFWLIFLIHLFPWLIYAFGLLALLSPIIAIAFLHHWLHKFLDNAFPDSKISVNDETPGFFPGLFSWWQGLYGWLVNTLSAYIILYVTGIFLPSIFLLNVLVVSPQTQANPIVSIWMILAQIVVAAFLYQIEYLVQKRLIAEGKNN